MEDRKPGIRPLPPGRTLSEPAMLLATWFGSGLLKPASGTLGTLAALPFAWVIVTYGGAVALSAAVILILYVGTKVAGTYNTASESHDASAIVIDEVAGIWLALIPAGLDWRLWVAAFLLFRLFDVLKPWPASRYENRSNGGWPVMMDDIWAGIYAFMGIASAAFYIRIL